VSICVSLRADDAGKMAQHFECQKLSIARLFAIKLFENFLFGGNRSVPTHAIFDR
jgi:hypothetical protein